MAQNLSNTLVSVSNTTPTLVFSGTGKVNLSVIEGSCVMGSADTITYPAPGTSPTTLPDYFAPPVQLLEFAAPVKIWAIGHPSVAVAIVRVLRWY